MKFCQSVENPREISFFKNYAAKEAGKLVPVCFLFFLKTLYYVKASGLCKSKSPAWFHYVLVALKLAYNRNKLFKTLHYWSRDELNFDILDKGLGIVSLVHFLYDFSTEMFPMVCYINWPNFNAWLPLLIEILGNMCTVIVC